MGEGPNIQVYSGCEPVTRAAAELIARQLRSRPDSNLLLPTGRTPLGMYRHLVELHRTGGVSFSEARFFNLDEYVGLPAGHPASYRRYMWEAFYTPTGIQPSQVETPDGAAPDLRAECRRYERAIEEAGGIDLCILGIGRNGHIGFNEPSTPFSSRTRVVRLAESTRRVNARDFEDGDPPERAITVGMSTIFSAGKIILLACGEEKAAAVASALEGEVGEGVPASLLRRHPEASFLLDRGAASALKRPVA